MIVLQSVTKRYHYSQYNTIDNLTMTVPYGMSTVLMDIQSGKSTLCKILLGLESYDGGNIQMFGSDIKLQHDGVALLHPSMLLWDHKSVLYNLAYPLRIRGVSRSDSLVLARSQADKYHLTQLLSAKAGKLTHQDRLALLIARVTIRPLQLVILDSFDSACTPTQWQYIIQCLQKHCDNILVLTSNSAVAVGRVYVVQDNTVVHAGDNESTLEYLSHVTWLYDKLGETHEQ